MSNLKSKISAWEEGIKNLEEDLSAQERMIAEPFSKQEELDKKVVAYIKSLSKEELRQTLYEVLYDGADWVFERFVREHIDY